jgi:hypothetical protein
MNRDWQTNETSPAQLLVGQQALDRIDIAVARTPAVGPREHNTNTADTKQKKDMTT